MPALIVDVRQLGLLVKRLNSGGGQGQVYAIEDGIAHHLGLEPPIVYKEYAGRPVASAAMELRARVVWISGLDPVDREELLEVAAWPLAVVHGPRQPLQGILMRDMAPTFAADLRLPSGGSRRVLVSLEHALQDDAWVHRRLTVDVDTMARARISSSIARSLQLLHRHGIVASDISQKNILVQVTAPYATAFIDCDGMLFRGCRALGVVETPGWEMAQLSSEPPITKDADNLKLALAIMRLFARRQTVIDIDEAAPYVPTDLRPMLESALGLGTRPTAGEWRRSIERLPFAALNRRYPGPSPAPATGVHTAAASGHTATSTTAPGGSPPLTGHSASASAWTPPAPPPAATPSAATPSAGTGPSLTWRIRGPVGAIGLVVAVTLLLVAFLSAGDGSPGSSATSAGSTGPAEIATTTTTTTTTSPTPPSGTTTTKAKPPRRAAASRALQRHYRYLDQGDYEAAFALMTPSYRRANTRWVRLRREADPDIRVVALRQRSRVGSRAVVSVRFYARDTVDVEGSDTKCRRFSGNADMVQLHGRWRFKPRRSAYDVRVVDSGRCH